MVIHNSNRLCMGCKESVGESNENNDPMSTVVSANPTSLFLTTTLPPRSQLSVVTTIARVYRWFTIVAATNYQNFNHWHHKLAWSFVFAIVNHERQKYRLIAINTVVECDIAENRCLTTVKVISGRPSKSIPIMMYSFEIIEWAKNRYHMWFPKNKSHATATTWLTICVDAW